MKRLSALVFSALALVPASYGLNISGGGTNVISAAINANATTGTTLVITDSATYTETSDLIVGRRWNGTARRAINIEVAPGQNPTIVLQGSRIVTYAGAADVYVGSNAGGKLTIDGIAAANPAIWYIGQEDGLGSGRACQATLENLEVTFSATQTEPIILGAGGNDAAPNTTSASLTLNNVTIRGGGVQVRSLYPPATSASTLNVTNSFFYNSTEGISLELGAYGLGGPNSVMNVSRTIVFGDTGSTGSADPNAVLQRLGRLTMDHCDVLTRIAPNVGRAVCLTDGTATITNSIIRANGAGAVNFGSGAATIADSNITGGVPLHNFTTSNVIGENPMYWSVGTDPSNLDQFAVVLTSLSRSHGTSPPLGARGPLSVPAELSTFSID